MTTEAIKYPNRLRECIKANGYKIQDVAEETHIPLRTLTDYCAGKAAIPRERLELLAQLLGYPAGHLVPSISHAIVTPLLWSVPHQRNPYFTGREALLQQLHHTLNTSKAAALSHPQAISGLGGIGKTQLALEYAYRYHEEYGAVFWLKADTRESLLADFQALARLLNLPEQYAEEQMKSVLAVIAWLKEHPQWLLIFDNVDDLAMTRPFLPPALDGHMLLTTRSQSMGGLAQRIEVECMTPEVGALFLLRRASLLAPDATLEAASAQDRALALQIVEELGGLPLALDQAGAYMEESAYHLKGYLKLYQRQRATLLKRRGGLATDHPEPVATTWALSFERVEQADPLAAGLLRLCAFLDPDTIPEELLLEAARLSHTQGDAISPDELRINAAIEVLLRFSLIQRNAEAETLTIHRLVQAVIQDTLDKETQRYWEEKVVHTLYQTFPCAINVDNWHLCQRYLPHVLACALHIEQWNFAFSEAAKLLNQTGYYLKEQAHYIDAERLYQQALTIREKTFGTDNPETAQSIYNLARLYFDQGKYDEAEQLYLRTLSICERISGTEHSDVAQSLNSLALLYWIQDRYEEAEPLFQRAISIREQIVGPEHSDTAHCLNNLALLYTSQGKYEEAERLHLRVLAIRKKVSQPDHLDTAQSLQNLASLYYIRGDQSKYREAEELFQQSLVIREKILGSEHPQTAKSLHNLALLYEAQGRYAEAEQLYLRALAIREKILGQENSKTIATIKSYVSLLRKMLREKEAAALEERVKAYQYSQLRA
jgi:tetratricopeptide (TPR) repeat protein